MLLAKIAKFKWRKLIVDLKVCILPMVQQNEKIIGSLISSVGELNCAQNDTPGCWRAGTPCGAPTQAQQGGGSSVALRKQDVRGRLSGEPSSTSTQKKA